MHEEDDAGPQKPTGATRSRCRVAVIWIDWYAYHVARFRGLAAEPAFHGEVAGIELVGGVGVHAGLRFREELPTDVTVTTLMPESSWSQAGQVRLAWKLVRHLTRLRPEMLLVPGYYTLPALAAALWARAFGARSVLMTESTADDHKRTWWKEAGKSLLIRSFFDVAVTGGTAHRRYLHQLGFEPNAIAGSYDVVDNEFFAATTREVRSQAAPGEFGLPAKPYFLYIGRLAPEKNVEGLLAGWLAYRKDGGAWCLVIVGDGPSANALRDMAAKSGMAEDVFFAGHRTSRELPDYYGFASCFVLPSTREPWGLVVNEAMASGLPVIVSRRCGCAEDLVRPENGLVFDPELPDSLKDALCAMANINAGQLSSMGEASQHLIASYSPQEFGRQISLLA